MKPLLSICCTAYNQEEYIEETITGFLNQKTDFPIEIIIHDDASTDNTARIIQSFAEKDNRIKTILQTENQYSQNIKIWPNHLFSEANGKYIALCEGDDYWTDPLKLQKQVDFLEANQDYVIAWTNYKVYNGKTFVENSFNHTEKNTTIDFNNLFSPYCTYTLTSVFKTEALDLDLLKSLKHFKDNSLYVALLKNGKGVFMDFESAVYRVHEGGVYSLQSDFFKNYSSYLNLKEVTDAVPESKTKNIVNVIDTLEKATAFEVLKLKNTGEELANYQLDFMESYFKNADFKTKFKYYKRLIKLKFLK
ncbi:glycosyltransferase [Xanthomarina sp. F1114]|uniref:glycosyltransferase family 2 protein n=1 Tax=Xanthomarina sp. F1114 TaxID=2996019 RepID=UPI00225DDB29|nr:glycosyltransferase [Xanthomarina sp. F1114]MCX7547125.1 glycosyltransferase [Xanthomarina sp. F1114]